MARLWGLFGLLWVPIHLRLYPRHSSGPNSRGRPVPCFWPSDESHILNSCSLVSTQVQPLYLSLFLLSCLSPSSDLFLLSSFPSHIFTSPWASHHSTPTKDSLQTLSKPYQQPLLLSPTPVSVLYYTTARPESNTMGAVESKVEESSYGYDVARVKATAVPADDIDKVFRCRCIGRLPTGARG